MMTDTEALETLKAWTLREHGLREAIDVLHEALANVGLKFQSDDGDNTDPFRCYERFRIIVRYTGSEWAVRLAEWGLKIGDPAVDGLQQSGATLPAAVEAAMPAVLALFDQMESTLARFKRVVAVASERVAGIRE